MKYMKQMILILVLVMMFFSCESAPKEEVFLDLPPVELESISLGFNDDLGSKISQEEAKVTYIPKKNEMSFYIEKIAQKTVFKLDEADRKIVLDAITKYVEDYDNKRLNKEKKAKKENLTAYGEIKVGIEWGGFSITAETETRAQLGYQFVDDSPYFAITLREAKNPKYNPDELVMEFFAHRTIYMTLDQLEYFYEAITKETINSLIEEAKLNYKDSTKDTY